MKIIELTAENIKRIKAVHIRPDTNLVEISGRNGQGKTSVLDSIWWALAGTKHIQAAPIRNGANEALIKLDLGTIKVTRTFKKRDDAPQVTTSVFIESQDGARFPSPQSMLDKLVGALSFDPLAFARSAPKEQLEALKRFVPDVDFASIQKAHEADYEARTSLNRHAKELRARLSGIAIPSEAPSEKIDETAIIAELEKAGGDNTALERRKAQREQAVLNIAYWRRGADERKEKAELLREQAGELEEQAAEELDKAATLDKRLKDAGELPLPIDTAHLRTRIRDAKESNSRFDAAARAIEERELLQRAVDDADKESALLTAAINKRDADKVASIAAAKMPIDGMTLGENEILLNEVPFDQASDSERLRASIAIAMASNPELRVIRVRDGSLLDEESMTLLAEEAADHDYQIWIERVGGDGKVGFIIEDGMTKGAVE